VSRAVALDKGIVDVLHRGIECFQQSRNQNFETRNGGFRDLKVHCEYMTAVEKAIAMPSVGAAHRTSGCSTFWGKLPTIDGAPGEDEFSEQ
jgi:hypothetical protein